MNLWIILLIGTCCVSLVFSKSQGEEKCPSLEMSACIIKEPCAWCSYDQKDASNQSCIPYDPCFSEITHDDPCSQGNLTFQWKFSCKIHEPKIHEKYIIISLFVISSIFMIFCVIRDWMECRHKNLVIGKRPNYDDQGEDSMPLMMDGQDDDDS